MTHHVRPAERSDIAKMQDFLLAMGQESEGIALNPGTLSQGIAFVFDHPEIARYWILEDTTLGEPVGMCMTTPEWSDWHNRFYWWFQSVYIRPESRGQGLIDTLMGSIMDRAQEENIRELRLYVDANNARAIRAYEKLGYHQGHYLVMEKPVPTHAPRGLEIGDFTNEPV
jgi:ribosomal protein S18 acetylase RimI-like enzyme